MARRSGVVWKGNLPKNLSALDGRVRMAMALACQANAPRAEGWMRANATWRDQTGNARSGLFARHESRSLNSHAIVLGHSVPYGIWLEVRWGGRYAIVGPAIDEWAPKVMQSIATYVFRRMAI